MQVHARERLQQNGLNTIRHSYQLLPLLYFVIIIIIKGDVQATIIISRVCLHLVEGGRGQHRTSASAPTSSFTTPSPVVLVFSVFLIIIGSNERAGKPRQLSKSLQTTIIGYYCCPQLACILCFFFIQYYSTTTDRRLLFQSNYYIFISIHRRLPFVSWTRTHPRY